MKLLPVMTGALALAGAATAQASGGENPMQIDVGLQVWTLVAFLGLFFLLAKFTFKPIAQALDRRSLMIKESLAEAEQARAEAKKQMDEYQKQVAQARAEAAKIVEEARQLGENVRKEVVEKAGAEAAALVQRAQEEIQRQKEKGVQELKDTVASLSVQIAAKVIEKEVNPATHRQLVDGLIADLGKLRRN
jgi:F-type H+-transporting ATPase subunit b